MILEFASSVQIPVKTEKSAERTQSELDEYISARANGMRVMERRYRSAVEEIITINELRAWTDALESAEIDALLRDIDIYYRLEMNINAPSESWNTGKR